MLFMLAGVMLMILLDITARLLLARYSITQLVALRCGFSMLVIVSWALATEGRAVLRTGRPGWHALRSCLMAFAMLSWFTALPLIPLAQLVTITFLAPILVTALSGPLLGEAVGPRRWLAVLGGFAGVVVLLRPGIQPVELGSILALVGTVLYAGMSLTARYLSATESTPALSLWQFPLPLLVGAGGALFTWSNPAPLDWLLFAACGAAGGFAFVAINASFRRAPVAAVVPLEYTGLIWASLAGYLIWDEVPEGRIWTGAAIIIGSGLYILYRETVLHRAQQADFAAREVALGHRPAGTIDAD